MSSSQLEHTFKCQFCSKCFAQKRYLKSHQSRCLGPNKKSTSNACTICSKRFEKSADLKRHLLHHSQSKSFTCQLCSKSFVQKAHLTRHISSVHDETMKQCRRISCKFCEKSFPTNWELRRHQKSLHAFASNQYKCRICTEKFDNQKLYVNHLENHKGFKPFSCDKCKFAFRRKSELDAHSASKHGFGFFFVCLECCLEFGQRTQIDRHILSAHPTQTASDPSKWTDENSCRFCPESFAEKLQLTKHLQQKHFYKIFRDTRAESDETELEHLVWKSIRINVTFDDNCQAMSRLKLHKFLPESLKQHIPGLSKLHVDLLSHKCNRGETLIVEIPVRVDQSLVNHLPTVLDVLYVA